MDYVYGKLDNNLVDINRLEYIQLKVCTLDDAPIEGLKSGQYYLETKMVDSDRLIYTDLSALNKDDDDIVSKLEQEIRDRISQGDALQIRINNEATRTDTMINQLNENVHSQLVALNKILVDSINTINGGIEEERKIREEADATLQSNLDKETKRVDSMVGQINNNIKVIVDQLNQNIAFIVSTINTNLDNESKERLKQDTILDNRITEEVTNLKSETTSTISTLTETVNKNKEEISSRVDQEVATLNSTISTAKQELQTNIDAVDKDLQDKYQTATEEVTAAVNLLNTKIDTETVRAKAAEQNLQSTIDITNTNLSSEVDRATKKEVELDNAIKAEVTERTNADNNLSQRIGNLEGKTTRLYYGEGTLSSPTATEIQAFITGLEVDPPYEPPYSGIAVVVKLTDENTYHI